MGSRKYLAKFCALCGSEFPLNQNDPNNDSACTDEHALPKQFYPKTIRKSKNLNLWRDVPTHRKCNKDRRKDEEYFYHASYIRVANSNPRMAKLMFEDLRRRTHDAQTPGMIRRIKKTFRFQTEKGILLPPWICQYELEQVRLDKVAIKIAQCLYYRDTKHYLPHENLKDIQLVESGSEIPEIYSTSMYCTVPRSVMPEVFVYWRFQLDHLQLFTMLFWGSFYYCVAFLDPSIDI